MYLYKPLCCLLIASMSLVISGQELTGKGIQEMQALLDSADAYQLKDPGRALEFTMAILQSVPEEGNERLCIRALAIAANSQKMRSQTNSALVFASEAVALSLRINDPEYLMRAYFMKATVFDHVDNQDSSLEYYQRVIDVYQPGMDAYFVSSAYSNVGQVFSAIGSYDKAEEYILKGYRLSEGDAYSKVFALARVISFYVSRDDPSYLPYLDTLAMTDFYKKASPVSFMSHFDSFLLLNDASDSEREAKLREVYMYATENSSLVNQVGFGMKLYEFLKGNSRNQEGYALLTELLDKAKRAQNGVQIAGITRALYENSKSQNDLPLALMHLERHSQLRDSMLSEENRAKINELNVKFETAQKDLEIAGQKTQLEQGRRNRIFLLTLAGLLSAIALIIFFFLRSRVRSTRRIAEQDKVIHLQERVRLTHEREVAELTASLETQERERNRIARDLHDGLGSMMSGISSQIEYLRTQPGTAGNGEVHFVHLREMVKDATAELRRTSYELMPAKLLRQGLEPAIRDLCLNLLVKNGLEPIVEINTDLTTLNPEQQLTIYRIIQELINNIVKHAGAKSVFIQFSRYADEISIVVEDDGKGFDVQAKTADGGLGLNSLQSRVNLLKGFLDIASTPGEGTTVTVNFNDTQSPSI